MDGAEASSTRSALRYQDLEEEAGGREDLDRDELIERLQADAQAAYDRREAEVGEEVMRELERRVLLSVLDRKWREHLYEMDYLREGIYLRAYSQRDPLVEYQREGFDMFAAMMDGIKEESVGFLFNLEVQVEEEARARTRASSTMVEAPVVARRGRAPAPEAAPEHPLIKAKGSRRPSSRRSCPTPRRREDGEAEVTGQTVSNADDPFAGDRPQRAVPLRLGQEVQEVPRRARVARPG